MQALGLVWNDVDSHAPDYCHQSRHVETPKHPGAALTLKVWQECAAQDGFVMGRDIPSRKLSMALRNLAVFEPIDGGRDFYVRVAGSGLYRRFDHEVTGARLSELYDPVLFQTARKNLTNVLTLNAPDIVQVDRRDGDGPWERFEVLLLPILSSDRVNRWALFGVFFFD